VPVRSYPPWFFRLPHALARNGALLYNPLVEKCFDEKALVFPNDEEQQPKKQTVEVFPFTQWLAP